MNAGISAGDSKTELAKNALIIVDGYGFVFRAYHVQPPLSSPDGTPVGALYGFTSMLLKLISDFKPSRAVIVLDSGSKNFRHDIYPEYKANRPPAPDDLVVQLKLIRQAAESLNFPVLVKDGYEADDIIATLALKATEQKKEAIIVSSDKDLMQLINSHVKMYDPAKGCFLNHEDVEKKFCVGPSKVRDVQALMGDKTDNIPGVAGIGPKIAAQLIGQFGSIEGIYAALDQIKSDNQRKKLEESRDDAFISYRLVGLDNQVHIERDIDSLTWSTPDPGFLSEYLTRYGFKSLFKRASSLFGIAVSASVNTGSSEDIKEGTNVRVGEDKQHSTSNGHETEHVMIASPAEFEKHLERIDEAGRVALLFKATTDELKSSVTNDTTNGTANGATNGAANSNGVTSGLYNSTRLYVSYFVSDNKQVWAEIDLNMPTDLDLQSEMKEGDNFDFFAVQKQDGTSRNDNHQGRGNKSKDKSNQDLRSSPYYPQLERILGDCSLIKITYDLKTMLKNTGCKIESAHDLLLMDYALSTGQKSKDLIHLLADRIGMEIDDESREKIPQFALRHLIPLYDQLKEQLLVDDLYSLYLDFDLPVCYILHQMEENGVRIDIDALQLLSSEFETKAKALAAKIYEIAGGEFNIGSPKQLGEMLFEKMSLPYGKASGKSGAYTTSVEVLEKLSIEGHEIAELILEYRHYTKLKSTYTDTLPKLADKETQRIHTTYSQSLTATSRLSSKDPNVQNIPIRSNEGNKIRKCFIAADGCQLISADYSQIELRILSHVANIETLQQAFREGKDIHNQTASQIFGVPIEQVDGEMRRKAKAINFGIIYGISGFGLAKQVNCSKKEASDYIERYFREYPGIRKYMDETVDFARKHGYTENIFGRRCYVPSINSKNHALRSYAERAAINGPLQSLNADIVKIAMICLQRLFIGQGLQTKMLLQIHDELIFEAPESEVATVMPLIQKSMEGAINMSVPAKVEVRAGNNWHEIH